MCIWDSYVYQKGVVCFLIHKSYVRSIKMHFFFRKYAAIPVQLEIFVLHEIGWCVFIIWTFIIIIIIIIITFTDASHKWEYTVWVVRIISELGIWYYVVRWPWPDIKCHRLDYWRKFTGT